MVQGGPSSQNSQRYLRHLKKIHIVHTYGLSAEGAKAGSKEWKRSAILPFSIVQSFFFVLFFSLCSNLSIWPGRQFVPDGSRCYIPIFDGLVHLIGMTTNILLDHSTSFSLTLALWLDQTTRAGEPSKINQIFASDLTAWSS